ncbi:hypothetical protein GW17_00056782, partial [Ensete ventricosum]
GTFLELFFRLGKIPLKLVKASGSRGMVVHCQPWGSRTFPDLWAGALGPEPLWEWGRFWCSEEAWLDPQGRWPGRHYQLH